MEEYSTDKLEISRAGDIVVGVLTTCIVLIGVSANSLALVYFKTRKTRTRNSKYFRVTYLIITGVDILVCTFMIPVAEAALTPGRAGKMFNYLHFCEFWGNMWMILPNMSICMVGVLSLSRLCVLCKSTIHIKKYLAWAIPGTCLVGLVVLLMGLQFGRITKMTYRVNYMICSPRGDGDGEAAVFYRGIITLILFTVIPVSVFVPIVITFILSLTYLRRAGRLAIAVNVNNKKHYHASKTVAVITFVYILFNLPFNLLSAGFMFKLIKLWRDAPKEDGKDWVEFEAKLRETEMTNIAMNYIVVMLFVLAVAANSMINPFVYFTRMKNFKAFIKNLFGQKITSVLSYL